MRDTSCLKKREFSVFFIDEGLGGNQIASALREASELVELLRDHVTQGELDEVWMRFAAEKNWMILTKDGGISRNAMEMLAVVQSNACVFALGSQKMQGPDMARVFTEARNRMKQFAKKYQGGFIARVTAEGKVNKWKMKDDLITELKTKHGIDPSPSVDDAGNDAPGEGKET